MSKNQRNILVFADWGEQVHPTIVGSLSAIQIRGKEIFSFEYN